jgi:hypothetical protein
VGKKKQKAVLLYHDMRVHEDYDQCSQTLFKLVQNASKQFPGKPRILVLAVQGHRNSAGGFDADALEIQREFLCEILMPYLTEAQTPLIHLRNSRGQDEDIPDFLIIEDPDRKLRTALRDEDPDQRRSKPSVKAIADYLGIGDPACMICWATPVERAHAQPLALGGSNDIRNFALLCPSHHQLAPDVRDSNSFWQWIDWRLSIDHPLAALRATPAVEVKTEFFHQVRGEMKAAFGSDLSQLNNNEWPRLMELYYSILDSETSDHFGVKRKVSTHAWALHRAMKRVAEERR